VKYLALLNVVDGRPTALRQRASLGCFAIVAVRKDRSQIHRSLTSKMRPWRRKSDRPYTQALIEGPLGKASGQKPGEEGAEVEV
jgi:hypothetical protein